MSHVHDDGVINKEDLVDQIEALTVDGEFSQKDVNYLINYLIAHGNMTGTPRDLIQIRRGMLEHLPNLAQGEMGFTLDTEELYVGGLNGNIKISGNDNKNIIDVTDPKFGAKPDDKTDNAIAFKKAVDTANAQGGGVIYLPRGVYHCSTKIISNNANIAFVGEGINQSKIVFTHATGGLEFNMSQQGFGIPPQQLYVANITIESRAAVSSPALSAEWADYTPNAEGQLWIENVHITRKDDGTGSFAAGIKLNKAIVGTINNCIILGDEIRNSLIGIELVDCIGIRITNCDVNRYRKGINIRVAKATSSEGVMIDKCFIYDVYTGIMVDTGIHVNITNSHININGSGANKCVSLNKMSQCSITGCLIYAGGSPGDPNGQNAIEIAASTTILIQNNNFISLSPVRSTYAIALSQKSVYNIFSGNHFSNYPITISFSSVEENNNTVIGNQFFNTPKPIDDIAPNNLKALNTSDGTPIDTIRWGATAGKFRAGEISTNTSWGGFIQGHSGSSADLALADSAGKVAATVRDQTFKVKDFPKATLPPLSTPGGLIYVPDATGGATIAFSDGTSWRRISDRTVIN